jgi:hypothetical protein
MFKISLVKFIVFIVILLMVGVVEDSLRIWREGKEEAGKVSDQSVKEISTAKTATSTDDAWLEEIPYLGELPDTGIDTSDWKTYRNEKYGYVVKYPPKWRIWIVPGDPPDLDFVGFQTAYSSDLPIMIIALKEKSLFRSVVYHQAQSNTRGVKEVLARYTLKGTPVVKSVTSRTVPSSFFSMYFKHEGKVFVFGGLRTYEDVGTEMLLSLTFD